MDLFVLQELVIVLAASVLIIYLSHKLKLPSVVGFLLTGVLIGPGGLSLVKNTQTVGILAEIGDVSSRPSSRKPACGGPRGSSSPSPTR